MAEERRLEDGKGAACELDSGLECSGLTVAAPSCGLIRFSAFCLDYSWGGRSTVWILRSSVERLWTLTAMSSYAAAGDAG